MNERKKLVFATIISGILILSLVGMAVLLLNNDSTDGGSSFPLNQALSILSFNSTTDLYRGENLKIELQINVTKFNVTVLEIMLEIERGNRISHSIQRLNKTYTPGMYSIDVSYSPGIWMDHSDEFFALSDGEYKFNWINTSYEVENQLFYTKIAVDRTINVREYPVTNMFRRTKWTVVSSESTILEDTGDYLSITSSGSNFSNAEIKNYIDFTGAYDFHLTISGEIKGKLKVGDLEFNISETEVHLNLANIIGIQNITLSFNSSQSELAFNFTLVNKKKVLLVGVADDHWSTNFPDHQDILDEVNIQFGKWFNVTFIVAIVLPVDYKGSTSLPEAFDFAKVEFGSQLNLPNGVWTHTRGRSVNNMGLDLLLFNTNKTMSNYGMVIGDSIGGFNMVANAGGSLNANGFRLQPSWADNLFQHELSHVFGAPDRYTGEDPPSIMTKSETLQDLLDDLANGTLWLELTNWLDEDLLTIASQFIYYENYIEL